MTCLPTSKDITIASGFILPSGISPLNRQNAAPLDPVSTKSGEGHARRPQFLARPRIETLAVVISVGHRTSVRPVAAATRWPWGVVKVITPPPTAPPIFSPQ